MNLFQSRMHRADTRVLSQRNVGGVLRMLGPDRRIDGQDPSHGRRGRRTGPRVVLAAGEVHALEVADSSTDLGPRPLEDNLPSLHRVDAIGDLERLTHVLFDEQYAHSTIIRRLAQRVKEALDDQWRQTQGELIGQQQPRLATQRSREREHLLLTARQEARGSTHEGLKLRKKFDRPTARDAGKPEVVGGGQAHEDRSLLSHEREASPRAQVQGILRRLTVDEDRTSQSRQVAGEGEQRRRLPRAVRPHEGRDLTFADKEIEVTDDCHTSISRGQPSALEKFFDHPQPPAKTCTRPR